MIMVPFLKKKWYYVYGLKKWRVTEMKVTDLSKIEYRKMTRKDHEIVRDLIFDVYHETWDYKSEPQKDSSVPGRMYESSKTPRMISGLYLHCLMSQSDYIRVADYRDEVIGVIFAANGKCASMHAGVKGAPVKLRLQQHPEGKANIKYMNKLAEMQRQLMSRAEEPVDSQVLFLSVRKKYRRNGVGEALLEGLYEEQKRLGKGNFFLQADLTSNHSFLEKRGFVRIAVEEQMTEHKNRRYREQLTLYKKESVEV